jgi:hypothetical protein
MQICLFCFLQIHCELKLKRKMKQSQKFSLLLLLFCLITSVVIFNNLLGDVVDGDKLLNSCGRFPREENILIDNVIWQVLETSFGFVYLLNAYLDTRWNKSIVRINAISPQLDIKNHKLYCQFWFDEKSQPMVMEASEYQVSEYHLLNEANSTTSDCFRHNGSIVSGCKFSKKLQFINFSF